MLNLSTDERTLVVIELKPNANAQAVVEAVRKLIPLYDGDSI